ELLAAAYGPNDLAAGETLHVATAWREGKTERATLFLHLVDGGGKQAAGSDRPLAGGYHATDGASLEDRRAWTLPADAAPGQYRLVLGLYDRDGRRVASEDGATEVGLGAVIVRPAKPVAAPAGSVATFA